MPRPLVTTLAATGLAGLAGLLAAAPVAAAGGAGVVPMALRTARAAADATAVCTDPAGETFFYHCYTPGDIAAAYGVDTVHQQGYLGDGQTVVLVDAYGTPTGASDLAHYASTFGITGPAATHGAPDFSEVYPLGKPDYSNANANSRGLSGPGSAAGWAGEASLDIESAFAIAPHAHIVLLATPPGETLGVQGLPNLMKAIAWAERAYPSGTVFSMSFGTDEADFGGAAATQFARFDRTFAAGVAKGDTFFSSAGDSGTTGTLKQAKESATTTTPSVSYPNDSPYVTSVGGTQLMAGWSWHPTSTVPFVTAADGSQQPNPAYFAYSNSGDTEAVWNEPWLPAAGGGGVSSVYPLPSWQDAVGQELHQTHRMVPDLSWNAAVDGGFLTYETYPAAWKETGDSWYPVGGTSAASPQVAALTALAVQARGGKGLGNLNKALYTDPALGQSATPDFTVPATDPPSAFRDVVPQKFGVIPLDNNQLWQYNADGSVSPGPVPGYPVLTGYDLATGWGSPRGAQYVAALRSVPTYAGG